MQALLHHGLQKRKVVGQHAVARLTEGGDDDPRGGDRADPIHDQRRESGRQEEKRDSPDKKTNHAASMYPPERLWQAGRGLFRFGFR